MTACGDLNGNGSAEIAVLGQRVTDDAIKVIVKDSRTGERITMIPF